MSPPTHFTKQLLITSVCFFIFWFLIFSFNSGLASEVQNDLHSEAKIKDFIVGAVNRILDRQTNCGTDFKSGKYLCNKDMPGKVSVNGGWDSTIIPALIHSSSGISYRDSNMFTTAHTLYPFWFMGFEGSTGKRIDQALTLGMCNINVFKRGRGFSFWPSIGPGTGKIDRRGPVNVSSLLVASYINTPNDVQKFQVNTPNDIQKFYYYDPESVLAEDALFHVPNDTDDTALGIISNYFYLHDRMLEGEEHGEFLRDIVSMGESINKYVDSYELRNNRRVADRPFCREKLAEKGAESLFKDIEFIKDCSIDDKRERWKYDSHKEENSYTGAYMTWAFDESKPTYSNPEDGVVLLGQNSVDCVVVANALYAISVTGLKNNSSYRKAYQDSCNTISGIIMDENGDVRLGHSGKENQSEPGPVWKYCGLFYPAHMIFPYVISRAVRDGGACRDLDDPQDQEKFDNAMSLLLQEIAKEQDQKSDNKEEGIWYEKIDNNTGLATALGTATLINLGLPVAEKAGMTIGELDSRIESGIGHLIATKIVHNSSNEMPSYGLPGGTFFGGGMLNKVILWKSEDFATAVALEASVKYLLDYQGDDYISSESLVRKKLLIDNIRKTAKGYTFDHEEVEVDQEGFNNLNLGELVSHEEDIKERLDKFEVVNRKEKKDRLQGVERSSVEGSITAGFFHSDRGHFGVVGVELTVGDIQDDGNTSVAYYAIKLKADAMVNGDDFDKNEYIISARFLGISTDNEFIKSDVGMFPVTIVKKDDIKHFGVDAIVGSVQSPLYKVNDRLRLDLLVVGKLLGYRHIWNDKDRTRTLSIGDLEIGVILEYGNAVSIKIYSGIDPVTPLGKPSRNIIGAGVFVPYRYGAKLKADISQKMFFTIGYRHDSKNGLMKSDDIFFSTLGIKF